MRFFTRLVAALIVAVGFCDASLAQSPEQRSASPAPSEQQIRERINAGTVGLAGGLLEGAPIRFATEIARVVNDGGTGARASHRNPRPHRKRERSSVSQGSGCWPSSTATRLKSTSLRCRKFSSASTYYAKSVSLRIAHLRSAGNSIAVGSGGQEGQLQHARHRRRLFRSPDFQPPRRRRRQDVYPAPRSARSS